MIVGGCFVTGWRVSGLSGVLVYWYFCILSLCIVLLIGLCGLWLLLVVLGVFGLIGLLVCVVGLF